MYFKNKLMNRYIRLLGLFFLSTLVWATDSQPPLFPEGEQFPNLTTLLDNIMPRQGVSTVAFSPAGKLLASGGKDNQIHLWDVPSGQEVKRLVGHHGEVLAIAFSPSGQTLASSALDHTVYLWEIASCQLIKSFPTGSAPVKSLAFSPTGELLALGTTDRTLSLWETASGNLINRWQGHSGAINTVVFSPNGQLLVSGAADATIRFWEIPAGKEIKRLGGHSRAVKAITFSPQGNLLISASSDQTMRLWNARSGKEIGNPFEGHANEVVAIAFSPDNKTFASASLDKTVRLWNVESSKEIKRLEGHTREVLTLAFSPDSKLLASGALDNTIRLWDVQSGQEIRRLEGHSQLVKAVAINPAGNLLAAGHSDHSVRLWELPSGKELKRLDDPDNGEVLALAFHPVHNTLVVGYTNAILWWDVSSGKELKSLAGPPSPVKVLAFNPDGKVLAVGVSSNTVMLWDTQSGKELKRLTGPTGGEIHTLAFSHNGKILATAFSNNLFMLWDLDSGIEINRFSKNSLAEVLALAFSPDGNTLSQSLVDNTVQLLDLPTGKETVLDWPKYSHAVATALAYRADGEALAIGTVDGKIHLWNLQRGDSSHVMVGGTRATWVSCDLPTQHCLRFDDGTLLLEKLAEGNFQPVFPSLSKLAGGQLEVKNWSNELLKISNGKEPSALPVTLYNSGTAPVYWINLVQSAEPETPLVFYPPATQVMLEPKQSVTLSAQVSAWAPYNNPRPQNTTLELQITSMTNRSSILRVSRPVYTMVPGLTLEKATLQMLEQNLFQTPHDRFLVMTLNNQDASSLAEIIFIAQMGNIQLGDKVIVPKGGQDKIANLFFLLPDDLKINKDAQVSLSARYSEHPIHEWHFPAQPVGEVINPWFRYVVFLSILFVGIAMVIIYYLRLYHHPLVVGLSANATTLLTIPLPQLSKVRQLLQQTHHLDSILSKNQVHLKYLDEAIKFVQLSPTAQATLLAKRLGAQCHAVSQQEDSDVFKLILHESFPLNLDSCLLYLPAATLPATAILNQLRQRQDLALQRVVIITVNADQQRVLRSYGKDPTSLSVVPDDSELTSWLLSPDPVTAFAQILADQLKVTQISPYQTRGGVNKEMIFFGRTQILAHIMNRELANYLVVGGRQIGKSSLLKHIQRAYRDHPTIQCHYLVLQDENLLGSLAAELGLPSDCELEELLTSLTTVPPGRQRLLLIDEADLFIHAEIHQGYHILKRFRSVSETGHCYFILAGFWQLYHASVLDFHSPIKNFGEPITIGALEPSACYDLATKPMKIMNLRYESEQLVEELLNATGQRANLIAIVCNDMLKGLQSNQRVFSAADLRGALHSNAVRDALAGWAALSDNAEETRLDRIIVYATVTAGEFKSGQLRQFLETQGCDYSAEQVKQSVDRLALSFVIKRESEGRYVYCVPLFREMLLEEDVEELLQWELKGG